MKQAEQERERLLARVQNQAQQMPRIIDTVPAGVVLVDAAGRVVLNDVTEARQVRAELAQQERLAAVGQLAAGIAHVFNNILASILLYAEIDAMAPDVPARFRAHVEIIESESRRAVRLVEQILDFGRRAVLAPAPFVKEQVKLLRRTLPESITVRFQRPDEALVIKADPGWIQQVLTNLAINARDVMPDGGELILGPTSISFGPSDVPPLPEMAPGRWVEITVSDTGRRDPRHRDERASRR